VFSSQKGFLPDPVRGFIVRTVLVCVRTPIAAQSVASCATRLGVPTVRTAVSEAEALARLAEHPAELILADTAVTRPDTVGFTRRVLAQAPRAVVVLFGAEEPRTASAAVSAGARGVIRGGDHDLVGTVAKALLLIGSSRSNGEPAAQAVPAADGGAGPDPQSDPRSDVRSDSRSGSRPGASAATRAAPAVATERLPGGQAGGIPAVVAADGQLLVPAQRGDAVAGAGAGAGAAAAARTRPAVRLRAPLTEREMQVLQGMAEGRSNAEIGRELYVSEDTVKTHARRLFRKLGARDRAHAVAVGFRSGVLP
jgi:DNA-binding NarL/FixJ family response regulator